MREAVHRRPAAAVLQPQMCGPCLLPAAAGKATGGTEAMTRRLRGNGEGSVGKHCTQKCTKDATGKCISHHGSWRVRIGDENGKRPVRYFKTEREAKLALKEAVR